jgi:hypothetical protein
VTTAHANGIGIIAVLGTGMPGWAIAEYIETRFVGDEIQKIYHPEKLAPEYKEYCTKIAEQFGDYVDYYQLFNEENHFAHSQLRTQDEPTLFEAGHDGLASKDPYFKTIVNVFANLPGWYDQMKGWLDSSANTYIDIIAIDHYPGTWDILASYSYWTPLDSLITLCNQYNKMGAIMETGYSTWSDTLGHGEDEQESFVNNALPTIESIVSDQYDNHPSNRIGVATWYELYDSDSDAWGALLDVANYHFGILRDDGNEKAAYDDLKTKIETFG